MIRKAGETIRFVHSCHITDSQPDMYVIRATVH